MTDRAQEALSPTKRALLAVKKLQAQVDALEYQRAEPIAIVGMSCRFPGGVNNPQEFWTLLRHGVDAITEAPADRWNTDDYYETDAQRAGKARTRYGGFLKNIDQFDAGFFHISPREAETLDPQQRLWLEACWEALESANIPGHSLKGSQTGVFAGTEHHDYFHLATHENNSPDIYVATGNMLSITTGRIAHFLGTQGPTMTIDTACSASLVAIHLGCQSLRAAECDLALAGGVNLILTPTMSILASSALAADGRCKTFSDAADGYGRGEGCGVVILKRLSDALAAGDNILAVIRGSSINHDGWTSGLTVPNGISQQRLIREALKRANVQPAEVSYVEAHGTGTPVGDPIEIEALANVYGRRETPLFIGSVKTNVGHLEAAAGVAGVIKTVLALQHREIPPHLHFDQPNRLIDWEQLPFVVPTSPQPWSNPDRIAGVSSFSLSGTNVHLILQQAPEPEAPSNRLEMPEPAFALLPLSAKSEPALHALANRYEQMLQDNRVHGAEKPPRLVDVCFTAGTGRTHFDHRLALTTDSLTNARHTLSAFQRDLPAGNIQRGKKALAPPKIAFLFTGQGSQYIGMGRQLYQSQQLFRQRFDQCDDILRAFLDKSLVEVLYPPPGGANAANDLVDQTAYTQPALFAVEYALASLWKNWGIEPNWVMGHSVGEYVAASLAGVMSLEESLKLIAARGRLMQGLQRRGTMLVVEAEESQVLGWIEPYADSISIAAVNGPQNIVISGESDALQTVAATLHSAGVKTKALTVSHAFHSPLMTPMIEQFSEVARQTAYAAPKLALIANLTGEIATADTISADYWRRHIRQPVRFSDGMATLNEQGCNVFIEVGPKPVLLGMGQRCLPQSDQLWLPTLRQGHPDNQQMLHTLGALYVQGADVDWANLYAGSTSHKVDLPTYPFQRQRYWVKEGKSGQVNDKVPAPPLVDLLHRGEAQQLTALLEQKGAFSQEQAALLPEIGNLLVQLYQRQVADIEQERSSDKLADWFYRIDWSASPRQDLPLPVLAQESWLILADQMGVGARLAELLRQHDKQCFLVYPGETYREADGVWTVAPDSLADFERLCASLSLAGKSQGVIHLWGLDFDDPEIANAADLNATQTLLCQSAFHLVQALLKQGGSSRLWMVTQGATAAQHGLTAPAQSTLWGLGRVIALEAPQLWGGLIDLAPARTGDDEELEAAAAILLTEVWHAQGEDQLAFRHGERYVARLAKVEKPAFKQRAQIRLYEDATYLITGGLGALGLHVARWMIKQGAKHLVLTGRRGITGKEEIVAELTQNGVNVKALRADVANAGDVADLLAEIGASMPPLCGIIHAAGVLDDGILLHQSWDRFQKVMDPKILGAWNLYDQTQNLPLEFLVFFSSATAILGNAGQGNYAAANIFMDALAESAQSQKRPVLSINWGSWSEDGMAARSNSQGESAIPPEIGLQALAYLLAELKEQMTGKQIGVMNIDWPQFVENLPSQSPFFSLLTDRLADSKQTGQPAFLPLLRAALPDERHEILQGYVKTEVAHVLGAQESPDSAQGFFDLGMDSLMALQLSNRLIAGLGIELPATLIFEYPSVSALTTHLLNELLASEPFTDEVAQTQAEQTPPMQPEPDSTGTLSDSDIGHLSAAELEALIDQEIAEFMRTSR